MGHFPLKVQLIERAVLKRLKMQKTLVQAVEFIGKGLHSGRIVRLKINPADSNYGIRFQRADQPEASILSARVENVSSTTLSTTIGDGVSRISTIEHLMAALSGLEVTNALVQVDGPEMPILDGSSEVFVRELLQAGLRFQDVASECYRVDKVCELRDGDSWIKVSPSDSFTVDCKIDFEHSSIGEQRYLYKASPEQFLRISKARTFCYLNDVERMRSQGLALGGSLDNAIVLNENGVMNQEGLRSNSEFVEHKLLDLIGDFALLGLPLVGAVEVVRPGHGLHAKFVKMLLEGGYLSRTSFQIAGSSFNSQLNESSSHLSNFALAYPV